MIFLFILLTILFVSIFLALIWLLAFIIQAIKMIVLHKIFEIRHKRIAKRIYKQLHSIENSRKKYILYNERRCYNENL